MKTYNTKNNNGKEFLSLLIMIIITVVIQMFTLIKNSIAAQYFGVSIEMDAFNLANSIGTFLFSFIGAGITTVLIPVIIKDKKNKGINIFISFAYSVSFIILILVYLNRRYLLNIIGGNEIKMIQITCNLLIVSLITQFIQSILGVTNAIFQCNGKFNLAKIITLLTGIMLALVLVLDNNINIYKYNGYIAIATIINVLLQVFLAYKCGFKFKISLDLKNNDFIRMIKLFIPTSLSTGLYQISLMTDTMISSRLGKGQVSILSYSNTIISMINTLLITNILVFLYPKIVEDVRTSNNHKKIFDLFLFVNTIMFLIGVGFIVIGREGIEILYQRGKFTNEITLHVYICSLIYILSLPANALRDLLYRYFYANEDTKTPFKNSLLISILNIVISIILSIGIGIYGVILGTVITSYISLSMIIIRFYKKFSIKYNKRMIISENLKVILISIITLVICIFLKNIMSISNSILSIIVYGFMTIIIYVFFLITFKSKVLKLRV